MYITIEYKIIYELFYVIASIYTLFNLFSWSTKS